MTILTSSHAHHTACPTATEAVEYCYSHPTQETGLHCVACDRPICASCMVPAPVGQLCRSCANKRRPVQYQISPKVLALAIPAAIVCAFILSIAAAVVVFMLPFYSIYLMMFASTAVGRQVVRLLDWLTKGRRGKTFQIVVGASLVGGGLPVLIGALLLYPFTALLVAFFVGMLTLNTMYQLR